MDGNRNIIQGNSMGCGIVLAVFTVGTFASIFHQGKERGKRMDGSMTAEVKKHCAGICQECPVDMMCKVLIT